MSEQQTATAVQATQTSACPHPEAVRQRWSDPISEERQVVLQGHLDKWTAKTDHGVLKGPFQGVTLSGSDASWVAEQSGRDDIFDTVPDLHLETLYVNPLVSGTVH